MTKKQYKLLNRIRKTEEYEFTHCKKEEKDMISFYDKNRYISVVKYDDTDEKYCSITQEGKAALYEWKIDKIYRLVPTYLAIFAAIGGYREELALLIRVLAKLLKL